MPRSGTALAQAEAPGLQGRQVREKSGLSPEEGTSFASLLGYSEPSTFYRAFRRWTDLSPREYRASQKRT